MFLDLWWDQLPHRPWAWPAAPCLALHGARMVGRGGAETGPIWDRAAASQVCTDGWGPGLGLSAPEGSLYPVGVRPAPHNRKPNLSAQPSPTLQAGAAVSTLLLFRAPRCTPHGSSRALGTGEVGRSVNSCLWGPCGQDGGDPQGPAVTGRHTPEETGGCGRAWWAGVGMSVLGGPAPTRTHPPKVTLAHTAGPRHRAFIPRCEQGRGLAWGSRVHLQQVPSWGDHSDGRDRGSDAGGAEPGQSWRRHESPQLRGGARRRGQGREKALVREAGQGRRDRPSRVPPYPQPPGSLQRCGGALPGWCL